MEALTDITDQSGSVASAVELLDRIEQLLQQTEGPTAPNPDLLRLLPEMTASLRDMRGALDARDQEIERLSKQSETLSRAQADAIVRSAEIIDELEQTKEHLSAARAAAEQAALDTRRLADTVFERTHDGVLVFQGAVCIACNDNALELLGCERNEILGGWPVVLSPVLKGEEPSASEQLSQLTGRRGIHEAEVYVEGAPRPFWAAVTISSFDMQQAGHYLMVVRDISARKEFEAELRRHRDFLDNIINAVPDQLSVKTTDDMLVLANDAFCSAHDLSRSEVVGRNGADFLPPEHRASARKLEEDLLTMGQCDASEYRMAQRDGSSGVFSVKRSTFQDDATGERFIVATSRDITGDRLREERLRLLASVFNGASEGVAILSGSGELEEANPSFLEMSSTRDLSNPSNSFTEALNIEVDNWQEVLTRVSAGTPWAGKATAVGGDCAGRSYWISLSRTTERGAHRTRIIALVTDISEIEQAQSRLKSQAHHDSLTGLPNRLYFRKHLGSLIQRVEPGESVAVCFLDLDDFKHVNDSAGHSAGDQLLRLAGRRIREVAGHDSFVSRFGGDEFAIVWSGAGAKPDNLQERLQRIFKAFREPFLIGDMESLVGVSIGVTRFPEDARTVETLMCNADIAMYEAKCGGKNRVRTFDIQMQESVETRHQVQSKLRRALSNGELSLRYQPKVCAETRQPKGCEALVRWITPEGAFISPNEFIPIAEQNGLIVPLGNEVIRQAAIQARQWFDQGQAPRVAVNISPQQLRHPRFLETLQASLEEAGAAFEWFELEITEHAVMDDVDQATSVIEQLSNLGCRIAIDDFGTGYSSLSYLKNFRINTLKIDLSFVRDLTTDARSTAVIRSIISLGAGLDLSVVAEGVETQQQADILSDLGCHLLQGYYFGRPMTVEEYEAWLGEQVGAANA